MPIDDTSAEESAAGHWRRRRLLAALAAVPLAAGAGRAFGQETQFFRIGTGSVSGTYYPIGGLIADIISSPPGSRPCDRGGNCGVPGLVAIAQTSDGSRANIEAMLRGDHESGFAQSDIAYRAFVGEGPFTGRPVSNLRALANLYQESLHLVTHPAAGIAGVRDLVGKRVSLDRPLSGTRTDAGLVLRAFGVSEDQLVIEVENGDAKIRTDHMLNFFECVRTRKKPVFDARFGANLPLLPDRVYAHVDLDHFYDFIDVTDRVDHGG